MNAMVPTPAALTIQPQLSSVRSGEPAYASHANAQTSPCVRESWVNDVLEMNSERGTGE